MIRYSFTSKNCSLLFLLVVFISACAVRQTPSESEKIEVTRIWDLAPHNAFTDLIRFNGNFYCSFREGLSHVSGPNGSVRVLKSTDGKNWKSIASFKLDGMDVRDPKLSVNPENRIMLLLDGETYQNGKVDTRKPYVSYSDKDGDSFSKPQLSIVDPSIAVKSDWVWRVTWENGIGYAIDYQPGALYLVKTTDGKAFTKISKIPIDGNPNEATIRFNKNGKLFVLIRRESSDKLGVLASSEAPYTNWKFSKLDVRLGGPNFIFLNDTTLCIGTRLYEQQDKATKGFTGIYTTNLDGKIIKTIKIPSGGDTSYPGMMVYRHKLWFSYYSSHEGKTSIYLAKVSLSQLQ